MRRSEIVRLIGSLSAAALVGCSSTPAPHPARPAVEAAQAARNVPFGLKVVDEVNDGQRLHILASIESRTDWDPRRVVVRLTGMSGERVLGVSDYPLVNRMNGGAPTVLRPGEPFDVSLSIPVKEVTDYQLELLWGEESGVELKSAAPSPLQLKNIVVSRSGEPCRTGSCPVLFEVSGDLTNFGAGTIERAALGVGFLPFAQAGASGQVSGIPADEEQIDLAALKLAPGKSRPIKLTVEQPALAGGGELTPVVRVLSFEAAVPVDGAPTAPSNAG